MNNTKELKTGRRKTSVAQVELLKGKGDITINAKSLEDYFGGCERYKATVKAPLVLTNLDKEYDVKAKVVGGGYPPKPAPCATRLPALWLTLAKILKRPSKRPASLRATRVWWKERNPVSRVPANASNSLNVNWERDLQYREGKGFLSFPSFLFNSWW